MKNQRVKNTAELKRDYTTLTHVIVEGRHSTVLPLLLLLLQKTLSTEGRQWNNGHNHDDDGFVIILFLPLGDTFLGNFVFVAARSVFFLKEPL